MNKLRRSTIKERIVICGFLLYFSSAGSWRNALFGTEPSWTRCHWFSIGLNWHGKIPLFGKAIAGLWYSCCHHQVSININFVSLFTSFLPLHCYQLCISSIISLSSDYSLNTSIHIRNFFSSKSYLLLFIQILNVSVIQFQRACLVRALMCQAVLWGIKNGCRATKILMNDFFSIPLHLAKKNFFFDPPWWCCLTRRRGESTFWGG